MKAEYITHSGDDCLVVNSARVSFNKSVDEITDKDRRLLKYLATHDHWTPFSHPQITLRETVPIFIARQRFKHTVGFTYNEVSRRYVDDTPEFFIPAIWRSRPEGSMKQGSGTGEVYFNGDIMYQDHINKSKKLYNYFISVGVAPEQARMVLPQSMYTSYYVTGSLAAFARAYNLRADGHAQKEIQELAEQWNRIIKQLYPESWKVLTEQEPL